MGSKDMLAIGDEVVYIGRNEERRGQKAEVVLLDAGELIELEFESQDVTGSRRLPTTTAHVRVIGSRTTVMLPALSLDTERPTDFDPH